MTVKLFLLGRPGCGKSSAAKHIIKYFHEQDAERLTARFKDFDILQDMFENDTHGRFQPSLFGGFDVIDGKVLDEAMDKLNDRICRYMADAKTDTLILIEFAREDYIEALQHFSSEVMQNVYFLFIDVNLDTCIYRVEQRMVRPETPDDHYISEKVFRQFYVKQKFPENKDMVAKTRMINNQGSWYDFIKEVDNFMKEILK